MNAEDQFGRALAAGDFDGNGTHDLAIGMPGEGLGSQAQAGAATILYGLLSGTGAFGSAHFGANITVSEAEGNRLFAAFREGGAVLAASAAHSRQGGSATPGVDFSYAPGTMHWTVGDVGFDLAFVHVIADTLDEADETIVLRLSNPSTGLAIGTPSTVTMTIEDDDEGGTLEFVNPIVNFSEGVGTATMQVRRSGGAASGVSVNYATANGSALAGQDFVARNGTLTFGAGQASVPVSIDLVDDALAEGFETFTITLSSPAGGAVLGTPTTITVFIQDNESDVLFSNGFE